ncbi:RNA polymerase sigma factor (sigma-70 family) [Xanthomonas arboricola]|uniref:RNA polymerase sigma factor n=1 Tax=Xanthomonas arboricola TaxID=56448 RepID=UPI000B06929D|nr:RNA polymerase sigma factor [Xanthomonas arboricola]NIK31154.1 RNA polymerase sigma factor (sigma-70 family) [Xanthomonas arboricola]NJC02700.1 RNA polymerase sigma factor (sigma-70 family) [Xanthomonas arboricola]
MVNDTLAGTFGRYQRFGSKWMPLPVERAINICTAWHRRSASGTTATTRTPYVVHPCAASMGGYTRTRHTTRWRVSEEPAAGRARFDQAIGLLYADLFAYMRRRLRDPNTADDLTQETLLRLLAYRDAPDIGDYALLMYRIAHNVVLEHWRTRHRRHANAHVALDLIAPLAADGAHVDQIADARRILQHLHTHTLPALPPKCRQAFILNRIDGLTYPQVAAAMGISIKMVEKHISRALVACRDAVQ